jgi:hypothetical protein
VAVLDSIAGYQHSQSDSVGGMGSFVFKICADQ